MSEGGGKREGSCPEPDHDSAKPRGQLRSHAAAKTSQHRQKTHSQICAAPAKSRLANYRLCEVPSHESLDRKEEEPAAPGGTGGGGGVQVRAGERLPEPPGRVLLPQAWLQWPG